jgi:cytochrome c-type biogenesis protein CcmE
MAGLKKKRRIQLISLGFACISAACVSIYYAAGDAFQYFYSPSNIVENPPLDGKIIRIGGLVVRGSTAVYGATTTFSVTDGLTTLPVTFTGIVPDLFAEGQGMIATGSLKNGIFKATEILAKHDEEYMPREVADALKEQGVYKPISE